MSTRCSSGISTCFGGVLCAIALGATRAVPSPRTSTSAAIRLILIGSILAGLNPSGVHFSFRAQCIPRGCPRSPVLGPGSTRPENSMLKSFFAFFLVLVAIGSNAQSARRAMTFEDMMAMKRLGETAVSPDGKWLAYSVTTVDLEKNSKTAELWLQKIEGGEPFKLAAAQAGDGGVDFASDGHSVLFLSGRDGGQQIWTADFDGATGATSNAK